MRQSKFTLSRSSRINNWETEGKYFFEKAIDCLKQNKFNDAYDNLINGYDFLTCDCICGNWFNKDEAEGIFSSTSDADCPTFKLDFLKAFIFNYKEQYDDSFNSINSFINLQPSNEIGYYFKGKILIGLKKYTESVESFERALELKRTNRTIYRIGRTKEQFLNGVGLHEMYEAIVMNPSSGCAHWHFAASALKRRLFETELLDYQIAYDKDENFPVKLGIKIEKIFAKRGKKGIKAYLVLLEKIMQQTYKNESEIIEAALRLLEE